MFKTPKRIALALLITTAFTVPALAADTPAVVEVMLTNIERQTQTKPTFESATEDDAGNVTIEKLTFKPEKAEVALTIDKIELTGVEEQDGGLYAIDNATVSGIKLDAKGPDGKGAVVEVPEATAESLYVKDAGDNPTPADLLRANMTVAKKMSTGTITVTSEGQTVTSDGYQATWDGDPATGAGTFDSKLAHVVIPAAVVSLMDPSGTMKNLGYNDLTFDFAGAGKTTMDAENMGVDMNITIAGKDMAALKFAVNADKIPLAVYGEIQKAQSAGKEPDFTALMPQLQAISLNGASFRFEDASLTPKLLPMIAAMSGMGTPDQLVANAGAMAQVGLMQLNVPDFTNQAVAAINTFLKEPKSFTIAAKPGSPVTVQQLMGLNPNDAAGAIKMLGVSVTAND